MNLKNLFTISDGANFLGVGFTAYTAIYLAEDSRGSRRESSSGKTVA
jgi:hypothetical protein